MPRVYLDSKVFFYAKIMDRVFGKPCSNVLRKVASGAIDASTSALVAVEVANALRKYGLAREVTAEIRAIFSLGIDVYYLDATDVQEAGEIFGEANIGPYDCAHAAIMRRNGLKEIISADKEFDKLKWLKRLDPRSLEE